MCIDASNFFGTTLSTIDHQGRINLNVVCGWNEEIPNVRKK